MEETADVPAAAQLRVIAASPDAPKMDFYAGGSALAYGLDFGTASSYVPLTPGSVSLAANTANSAQLLVTANAGLTAGQQYTAIVTNVAASLQETVYPDQTRPAPRGEVALRVIDAATRVGSVDVYLVPTGRKLAKMLPVRTGVSFGASSGYILAPAGTYSLVVLPTGTVPSPSTQTLLTAPQTSYAPGSVRTVVLVDHVTKTTPGLSQIVASDYEPA
ncbi:MAG TPA: DUF4397 domain-containing protein [Acidobacteriaceae bacterium]|jgi:hypothetical protein|nr:DUF4397 domain-containing protein [Acidobacteriaceae bacterium]